MAFDDAELNELTRRVALADQAALGRLLECYRPRLRAMIQVRLDRRVRARVDPSDVLQEAFLEASLRLDEFSRANSVPFYVWLRQLTGQRLAAAYRFHLGTQGRDAGREVALSPGAFPVANSDEIAAHLIGRLSSPSTAAIREELTAQLKIALDRLDELDREIIVMRHFEELSNSEAALVLDLKPSAVCNRYVRALERLRLVLDQLPGFSSELWI